MFASDSAFRSQAWKRWRRRLFGGETHGLAVLADHLAHVADAARALGLGIAGAEDFGRARGAGFDGGADFALADAVTVADVQGGLLSDDDVLVSNANAVANHLQVAIHQSEPPQPAAVCR